MYKKPSGPNVWVVSSKGRFAVKEEGRRGVIATPRTQRAAITIARRIARQNGSELIIQATSGRIRAKDSHGADRSPPKG